jgi:hypothetical protein
MHREHLNADVGDQLVIESSRPDMPRRHGEILEVHGEAGAPPYVVRWSDGRESAVYPGPLARIEPAGPPEDLGPEPSRS